jgi:hypothetical protein
MTSVATIPIVTALVRLVALMPTTLFPTPIMVVARPVVVSRRTVVSDDTRRRVDALRHHDNGGRNTNSNT